MGTVVNGAAIVVGGLLGLLLRRGISPKVEQTTIRMLGLVVLVMGIEGVMTNMKLLAGGSLVLVASLVLGAIVGESWDIEGLLNRGGKAIERKLGREGFAKGFINASLVFCVGAMSIVGALNDGLYGDSQTLFTKAALDGMYALMLTSALGYGVIFSFIPVVLYQGAITLCAKMLEPFLSPELQAGLCMVGYAIVMCIALNFMQLPPIRTANLLPALLVPILYYTLMPLVLQMQAAW